MKDNMSVFLCSAKYTLKILKVCKVVAKTMWIFSSMFMYSPSYHIIHICQNSSENDVDMSFSVYM